MTIRKNRSDTKPVKHKNKLNPKQLEVVKRVAQGQSKTQAYKEVYGVSQQVAETNGPRLLGNAGVQQVLEATLRRMGHTEESIGESLDRVRGEDDWRAQIDYVKITADLLGLKKEQPQNVINTQIINYEGLTDEQLDELLEYKRSQIRSSTNL